MTVDEFNKNATELVFAAKDVGLNAIIIASRNGEGTVRVAAKGTPETVAEALAGTVYEIAKTSGNVNRFLSALTVAVLNMEARDNE